MDYKFVVDCHETIIKKIKIIVDYDIKIDGINRKMRSKSNWLNPPTSEPILSIQGVNINTIYFYLITKNNNSYRHKFNWRTLRIFIDDKTADTITIQITRGQEAPVVKINNSYANRMDQLYVYSPWTFICGCCDVRRGLDDLEQSEIDADKGCVIL